MKHHGMRAVFLVCAVLGAHSDIARAQPVRAPVQAIARYMQPAPGGLGNFRLFADMEDSWSPSISGDNVVFKASIDGGSGIYAHIDGQLVVVADSSMKIPGSNFNFAFGGSLGSGPTICGPTVVFKGLSLGYGSAIWRWQDGLLEKVVDTHTLVPGHSVTFGSFPGSPGIDGENIAFLARHDDGTGVYAVINGELRTIAEKGMFLPGAAFPIGTVGGLTVSPAISGQNVAFFATTVFTHGLYLSVNGEIRVIAETGSPTPSGGSFPTNFGLSTTRWPGISGENVVFSAPFGVYAYINGTLRLIANTNTPAPGGGTFGGTFANRISIDGENIAFGGATVEGGGHILLHQRRVPHHRRPAHTGSRLFDQLHGLKHSGGCRPGDQRRTGRFLRQPGRRLYRRRPPTAAATHPHTLHLGRHRHDTPTPNRRNHSRHQTTDPGIARLPWHHEDGAASGTINACDVGPGPDRPGA